MSSNSVAGAKWLIRGQVNIGEICNIGTSFSEYQKVYPWTNEYIKAYLELADFSNKERALSVMASGDQTFNLIVKGFDEIDTFDTNRLTEFYVLGFKRAMILKYDYHTFIRKMIMVNDGNTSIEEINELILELLPYMEKKHAMFWKQIIDYNYRLQREKGTNLNLFSLITLDNSLKNMDNLINVIGFNNYLYDDASYEALRSRLGSANISFKCVNAADLAKKFKDKKYDTILLSNIPNYFAIRWELEFGPKELQEYERELGSIMNDGGTIFLNYIFNYGVGDTAIKSSVIGTSSIREKDLTNGEEIYRLPFAPNKRVFDGMILKRIRYK